MRPTPHVKAEYHAFERGLSCAWGFLVCEHGTGQLSCMKKKLTPRIATPTRKNAQIRALVCHFHPGLLI